MCPNNWDLEREKWSANLRAVLEHYLVGPDGVASFKNVRPVGDPIGTLPVRGSKAGPNQPGSEEVQRGDL